MSLNVVLCEAACFLCRTEMYACFSVFIVHSSILLSASPHVSSRMRNGGSCVCDTLRHVFMVLTCLFLLPVSVLVRRDSSHGEQNATRFKELAQKLSGKAVLSRRVGVLHMLLRVAKDRVQSEQDMTSVSMTSVSMTGVRGESERAQE